MDFSSTRSCSGILSISTQPGKFFTATGEKPMSSRKASVAFCLPPLAGSAAEPEQVKKARGHRAAPAERRRSEEHTSDLESRGHLVCRLLLARTQQGHLLV